MSEISSRTTSIYCSALNSPNPSQTSLSSTHSYKSKAESTNLNKKNSGIFSEFSPFPGNDPEAIAPQKTLTQNAVPDFTELISVEESENPNISRNNFFSNPNTSQISLSSTHSSNSTSTDDLDNVSTFDMLSVDGDSDDETELGMKKENPSTKMEVPIATLEFHQGIKNDDLESNNQKERLSNLPMSRRSSSESSKSSIQSSYSRLSLDVSDSSNNQGTSKNFLLSSHSNTGKSTGSSNHESKFEAQIIDKYPESETEPTMKKKKNFSNVRNVTGQIWGKLTEEVERGFNSGKSLFKMLTWKNKQKSSKKSEDSISIHSDQSELQLTEQKEDDSNSTASSFPPAASSQTPTSSLQSGTTEATTSSVVWPSLDNKTDLRKKLAEQIGTDGQSLLKSVKGGQPILQTSNAVEEGFSSSIENVLEVGVTTKRKYLETSAVPESDKPPERRDTKAFSILNRGRPIKRRTSDNSPFLGQGLERGQTFSASETEKSPTKLKHVVGPKQKFLITNFYKKAFPSEEEKAKFEQKLVRIAEEFPKFQEAYDILEIPIIGDFRKIHDAYKAKKQKIENSSLSKADKDKKLDEIAEAAGILCTGTHRSIADSRTIL